MFTRVNVSNPTLCLGVYVKVIKGKQKKMNMRDKACIWPIFCKEARIDIVLDSLQVAYFYASPYILCLQDVPFSHLGQAKMLILHSNASGIVNSALQSLKIWAYSLSMLTIHLRL